MASATPAHSGTSPNSAPANKTGKLSERQLAVLCFVEQTFWTTGGVPTNEKISETLDISVSAVKKYWENPTFRAALSARGVDFSPARSKGLLTVMQLTLANSLLNLHDKRSTREKLKELSITPQQYNAWLATPAFRDYLAQRGEQLFGAHDHEAYAALLSGATGGDVPALKLFFEMRGIYNPKVNVEVNLPQVLGQVVEIIARHVSDPGILAAIADELEVLETGGRGLRPRTPQAIPEVAQSYNSASPGAGPQGIGTQVIEAVVSSSFS